MTKDIGDRQRYFEEHADFTSCNARTRTDYAKVTPGKEHRRGVDKCHPDLHGVGGDVTTPGALEMTLEGHRKWLALHEDIAHRYCEHGRYVGHERSLAFLCPFCPEL